MVWAGAASGETITLVFNPSATQGPAAYDTAIHSLQPGEGLAEFNMWFDNGTALSWGETLTGTAVPPPRPRAGTWC